MNHFLFYILLFISSALYAKTPLILDTDMGFDDWVAVLYVLQNQSVEVKAITVDCNGLTYCPQGGINATKLAGLAHNPVPVYIGQVDQSEKDYFFPAGLREYSSQMAVPGFTSLKAYPAEKKTAARAIFEKVMLASNSNQPLVLLSIGTAINIRDALQIAKNEHQEEVFKKGILRIDKAGGAFGLTQVKGDAITLTNHNIQGNLSIPGFFATNNTMAEWNVYAGVEAMRDVMQSGIPIRWIAINASDQAHITPASLRYLEQNKKPNSRSLQFSINAAKQLVDYQGGWNQIANNLDYWDTSAVIAALHPDVVTEFHDKVALCLVTDHRTYQQLEPVKGINEGQTVNYSLFKASSHYYYGALVVVKSGKSYEFCAHQKPVLSSVVKQINVQRFYEHFAEMG